MCNGQYPILLNSSKTRTSHRQAGVCHNNLIIIYIIFTFKCLFPKITSECHDTVYGDTCEDTCYSCKQVDGRNCDRHTGVCSDGCYDYHVDRDWWTGPKCEIKIREYCKCITLH